MILTRYQTFTTLSYQIYYQIFHHIILNQNMENVLIIGATGNIGIAAVLGALRSKRNVLAVVRNQASAEKLFQHIGTRDGITTVEADIMSDGGVQAVVDQV